MIFFFKMLTEFKKLDGKQVDIVLYLHGKISVSYRGILRVSVVDDRNLQAVFTAVTGMPVIMFGVEDIQEVTNTGGHDIPVIRLRNP